MDAEHSDVDSESEENLGKFLKYPCVTFTAVVTTYFSHRVVGSATFRAARPRLNGYSEKGGV